MIGHGTYPGTGSRGPSRRMRSRTAANGQRGIAASAIWKITYRECVATLASILISFSRSVVGDRCFTGRGHASANTCGRGWLQREKAGGKREQACLCHCPGPFPFMPFVRPD